MKRHLDTNNKKPKKLRVGKVENLMYLRRNFGDEPTWQDITINDPDYRTQLSHAYNWANAAFDPPMLKKITLEYFSDKEPKEKYEFLKEIPDYYFLAVGKDAWLRMSGAPTTKEMNDNFENNVEELRIRYGKYLEDKNVEDLQKQIIEEDKVTPDQVATMHYVSLYAMIDNMIITETITDEKIYDLIRNQLPSPTTLRLLLTHYSENIEESNEYETKNKLKGLLKDYHKKLKNGSTVAQRQIEKILSNVRAENKLAKLRKPRVRKVKPANMQVKNLQFKDSDASLKLVSIPPTAIIRADTLVTFNTRTRKISIFYAKNTDGLTVKGTTVQNYDEEKSKQKTIRKPEQMIPHLIDSTLMRFEKVFEGVKAVETTPKGRINEDILLLKVFKIK